MSSLDAASRRLGGLAWVSGELFAIEGRWAATMSDPAAVEHLATHSRHHGWHRTLWIDALPDSPALGATGHIGPPDPGWEAAVACLDEAHADPDAELDDAHRLAALYRGLVPRLLGLLADFGATLGGPGDGAIERVVGLAAQDVAADLHGGQRLLAATLGDLEAIEQAAATTKMLDQAFRTW